MDAREKRWGWGWWALAYVLLAGGVFVVRAANTYVPEPKKYPSGFDTVASFGDGSWQIVRLPHGRALLGHGSDTESGDLLAKVYDWREEGDWVCAYGEAWLGLLPEGKDGRPVYVALNIRSGLRFTYESLERVPAKFRAAMAALKNEP